MEQKIVISASRIKKHFRQVKAVDGVNIEVRSGEFIALLGPNGAGKTTFMEMIEGIQHPDEGEILVCGKTWKGNEDEIHRLLGISLQETFFIEKLTTEETLMLFASFYSIGRPAVEDILKLTHLGDKRKAYTKSLSGGQRQRLALGIALINEPKILLLDEPTSGLDPTARHEIWNILLQLKKEKNITLILTTHYMEEAEFLCDRIVVMDKGKILDQGTVDELLSKTGNPEIILFSIAGNRPFHLPDNTEILNASEDEKKCRWKLTVQSSIRILPTLLSEIEKQGLIINDIECRKMTLDDLFLSMTGRTLND